MVVAVGVNVTPMVQELFAAKVNGKVVLQVPPLRAKFALIAILDTITGLPPVLGRVTNFAALVVFMFWLPKDNELGVGKNPVVNVAVVISDDTCPAWTLTAFIVQGATQLG